MGGRLLIVATATKCNTLQHIATHCNTLRSLLIVAPYTKRNLQNRGRSLACEAEYSSLQLQHTATHCNTLQHTEKSTDCCHPIRNEASLPRKMQRSLNGLLCSTLQHTATRCNTLQQEVTHCNALQYVATGCNRLQRTDALCILPKYLEFFQKNIFFYVSLFSKRGLSHVRESSNRCHCNTLQHSITHCNTL